LHVEEAEDKLVQNTETAIGLMKSVLENVSCRRFPLDFVVFWQGKRKLMKTARAPAEPLQPRQGAVDLPFYRRRDFERELACPDPPCIVLASAGAEADM
jgi:hypothetical protein